MTVSPSIIERLVVLGKEALASGDVPIAAVLLYHGEVIGEGYNTVVRTGNAGEHAEVNAISAAIRSVGAEKFRALDRKELLLVSTFEPCVMCIGACINNGITRVAYLQPKNGRDRWKELRAMLLHVLRRGRLPGHGEQIELFRLHPDFGKQRGYQ